MKRAEIDHLGILPLAGVCTYDEACKAGYDVDRNVNLLKRYNYVLSSLNRILAAHIARTPEWEVKCAFGLHSWLVAEHAAALRTRVAEMREPPLHLDTVPDVRLQTWMDEVIRATSTAELLTGIYHVVLPELVRALDKHVDETNPLVDYPTCRMIKTIHREARDMVLWGEQALTALTQSPEQSRAADLWADHLRSFLRAAGGIADDLPELDEQTAPRPRAHGQPYDMDATPQRDHRFVDRFNCSARIDEYYRDEDLEPEERVYALMYKRLREMDVPEWMGPILYKTQNKPWDYYVDLSRQLWDEVRHAMMGEVSLYRAGVPFYRYPISILSSAVLNHAFTPREAHLFLWGIEQSLMPRTTGKRYEWDIARSSHDALTVTYQDYDWADEVLHAQIGRRWLVPDYGSMDEMRVAFQLLLAKFYREVYEFTPLSPQEEWWPAFVAEIRQRRTPDAPVLGAS